MTYTSLNKMRQKIDIQTSPRGSQYTFFRSFGWPFLDVVAQVDMTDILAQRPAINGEKIGVFATCMHALIRALNDVPEFRQRIEGNDVFEYAACSPSFTVMGADGVFNYTTADFDDDLATFAQRVQDATERVKHRADLNLDNGRADLVFVTCLPWIDFVSLSHPRPLRAAPNPADDSIPRLAWGKIVEKNGRKMMSVGISAHHGLVDGVHLGRFYEALQSQIPSAV